MITSNTINFLWSMFIKYFFENNLKMFKAICEDKSMQRPFSVLKQVGVFIKFFKDEVSMNSRTWVLSVSWLKSPSIRMFS